jgi:hypothetical protein
MAKVIGVSVNILAWVMCSFSIYNDFYCGLPWPCAGIRCYLFAEVVTHAITISSVYSAQENGLKLILGTMCFVITLTLLILAQFRKKISMMFESNRFRFSDEKLFSEDDIFSESADSFTSANINVSFQDSRPTRHAKRRSGFFSFSDTSVDAEAEEGLLGRCSDLSDSSYYSGHYRDSDLGTSGLPSSWRAHGHEEQSHVQSIIERNLQPTQSPKLNLSSTDGGGHSAPSSPTKFGPEGIPSQSSSPSSALARAMRHSSRSANALSKSASGMVGSLAPKGVVPRQNSGGGVGMGMRAKDIQSSDTNTGRNKLDDLQIRMGKYGFRRENDIYAGSGVKSFVPMDDNDFEDEDETPELYPTRLSSFDRIGQPNDVKPDGTVARPKLRDDIVSYKNFDDAVKGKQDDEKEIVLVTIPSSSSLMMEVEFEILFQLTDSEVDEGNSTQAVSVVDSAIENEGADSGPVPRQWTVWRTGKELLSLHAVLVCELLYMIMGYLSNVNFSIFCVRWVCLET